MKDGSLISAESKLTGIGRFDISSCPSLKSIPWVRNHFQGARSEVDGKIPVFSILSKIMLACKQTSSYRKNLLKINLIVNNYLLSRINNYVG